MLLLVSYMSTHNYFFCLPGFVQGHPPPLKIAHKNTQQRALKGVITIFPIGYDQINLSWV